MTMKPSDFPTRAIALEYVNTRLDEWMKKCRELEEDIVSLAESPTSEEVQSIKTKWQERVANLQEVESFE